MKKSLIYGPVASRRLGRSLGVDIVPYKICTYDCIYCQIGRTPDTTIERRAYIRAEQIIDQLREKLDSGIEPDYITLGGSGEPTLNSEIGSIIRRIKEISNIPVAVLTNGSLLSECEVSQSLIAADVVLPSLDAYDPETFAKINRPHASITYETMISGLSRFRNAYGGQIWLEVFLVAGINATPKAMKAFLHEIEKIRPDRIHLNTAVRPPAEPHADKVPAEKLAKLAGMLGEHAEVIAEYTREAPAAQRHSDAVSEILNLLARRPCTIEDITAGLKEAPTAVIKNLDLLMREGRIVTRRIDGKTYYLQPCVTGEE